MKKLRQKLAILFLKCTLKKPKQKKQSWFLFKPVLIFSTFKDVKKQAAELTNITSLLPLLFLLLLLFSCFLVAFFIRYILKKRKSVLTSSVSILLISPKTFIDTKNGMLTWNERLYFFQRKMDESYLARRQIKHSGNNFFMAT